MADEFTSLVNDLAILHQIRERNPAVVQRAQSELRKSHATGGGDDWVDRMRADHARAPVLRRQQQAAAKAQAREMANVQRQFDQLLVSQRKMMKSAGLAAPLANPTGRRERFAKAFSQFQEMVAGGRLTASQASLLEAKFHQLAETLR